LQNHNFVQLYPNIKKVYYCAQGSERLSLQEKIRFLQMLKNTAWYWSVSSKANMCGCH